jgi:hypothetical protein
MAKISGKVLREIFEESIKDSGTYKRLDDGLKNPAHIIFNGVECYVYIKNLSYAYLGNPDVWRAQLTGVDVLNEIKESPAMFILLGYDSDNDVYATWNPHQVKQRIGTASSPSLYSRLSLQQEVGRTGEIKSMVLNNDLEVLVFPNGRLVDVLSNLDQFFPDTSDYVAMGSKRRSEANAAYKELTNTKKLDEYAKFLLKAGVLSTEVERLCQALKRLFNSNLISLHRKVFLAHDSLEDYHDALVEFFNLDDVVEFKEKWGNIFPAVFSSYIGFLQHSQISEYEEPEENEEDEDIEDEIEEEVSEDSSDEQVNFAKDWEKAYEDEHGNLTKLMNPELLKMLRPYLDTDYPSLPPCYNIIGDFYAGRYPKMQLKDWGRLFNGIEWDKCNEDGIIPEEVKTGKKKSHILRVTFPDGFVIEDRNVSKTFAKTIEMCTPDLVKELNIVLAGVDLVSDKVSEQYGRAQHQINDGSYVMTHMSTEKKREILQYISNSLGLDLKIDKVLIDSGEIVDESPISTQPFKLSSRQKIWVQFPDGHISNHARVMQTLVDVVIFAGPERVRDLNIIVCGDNLVTSNLNPTYTKAYKEVGEGLYVNTASDTKRKYQQIMEINEALDLDLIVRLD